MTKNILTTAFVLAGALLAVPASAQDFPTRTITMNMPYSAGGPGDTIARLLAQGMSGPLKQQVIVENTTGAGGSIGSAKVAASSPDGYNLLLIHISHATNPALYPKLKYDPIKDYEPIGLAVDLPSVFVARKDLPAANLAELIAWMKTNKEKVNYAHAGIGSASHLCGLLLNAATGTQPTQIAYRGAGPAMNDMMSGQVDVMCDQIVNVVGNVDGGTIKGYAVTSTERAPALPKLPTTAEGGLPGFTYTVWYGLFAPKGTPKPIIDKLVAALNVALKDETVKSRLAGLGVQPVAPERATPEALAAHLKSEIDKWTPIIKAAGVVGAQ
ncbi:tripartite tricarboxylate transporter substrate-binding protein [Tardiphaga sp. 813_E8_N1_3]|uniref:tripartite tricarboxylate transporter substrate-binding protein n=1 Tax=Tardiphaga sp. 813_E8_N1_3 TaxID=3240760 RepID=UPI003F266D8D